MLAVVLGSDTLILILFFFNDTATTEIYTLSLHDALPISFSVECINQLRRGSTDRRLRCKAWQSCDLMRDRKSTRLNSSHSQISYAVFCLKKKKQRRNDSCCTSTC